MGPREPRVDTTKDAFGQRSKMAARAAGKPDSPVHACGKVALQKMASQRGMSSSSPGRGRSTSMVTRTPSRPQAALAKATAASGCRQSRCASRVPGPSRGAASSDPAAAAGGRRSWPTSSGLSSSAMGEFTQVRVPTAASTSTLVKADVQLGARATNLVSTPSARRPCRMTSPNGSSPILDSNAVGRPSRARAQAVLAALPPPSHRVSCALTFASGSG
mmetsp:Transcript_19437/g.61688  ORF Transcript_19437/g.61688 Transcript_19437/m.61688 type:complete len:218 (-) Transcript_19437:125-778(-)